MSAFPRQALSPRLLFAAALTAALALGGCGGEQQTGVGAELQGVFADENLEAAVRRAIGGPITAEALNELTALEAADSSIGSVSGLERCPNLIRLDLSGNALDDVAPLAALSGLADLRIGRNVFLRDLRPISSLTGMTFLFAGHTMVRDVSPLASLTNLTELRLDGSPVEDISSLAALAKLSSLSLASTGVSDISPLAALAGLESLWLGGNEIADISALAALDKLKWLHISNNQISDISPLASVDSLTWLYMSDNQVENLSPLSSLSRLTWLHLDGNPASSVTALSGITSLTEVVLEKARIADPSPLARLPNATVRWIVSFPDPKLEEAIRAQMDKPEGPIFVQELGKLTTLVLSGRGITDLTGLEYCTSLRRLELDNNKVSDLSAISALDGLSQLVLDRNEITDLSPLAGLTKIFRLSLRENQIQNLAPLVSSEGITAGDPVDVTLNPLGDTALSSQVPELEQRGVRLAY